MSVFFNHFLNHKRCIIIIIFEIFLVGFFFGFYQYNDCQDTILSYMQNLFYVNSETYSNQYSLYLIENVLFIFICTYLSSSYIGSLGILLLVFLKGMQLSFSLINILSSVSINTNIIISLFIELCLELSFIFILSLNCSQLSLYVTYVTFISKNQLDIKRILNYLLNYLIISFILLTISLSFRIYIIPIFS